MFVGYLLWLFLSRITSPEVIGISSTVISLTIILSVIVDLGVSRGSTRFLGKSFSEGEISDARVFVKASILLVSSGVLVCVLAMLVFKDWIFPAISFDLFLTSILLVGSTAIFNLLRSFLIASLQTQSLPIIMAISSAFKVALTIFLVLLGTGALGITIGYMSAYLSAGILLFLTLITILKSPRQKTTIRLHHACKSVIIASVVSWYQRLLR